MFQCFVAGGVFAAALLYHLPDIEACAESSSQTNKRRKRSPSQEKRSLGLTYGVSETLSVHAVRSAVPPTGSALKKEPPIDALGNDIDDLSSPVAAPQRRRTHKRVTLCLEKNILISPRE